MPSPSPAPQASSDDPSSDFPANSGAEEAVGAKANELLYRTATLARLEISAEEAARLGPQFEHILHSFRDLASVDVTHMEAMTGPGQLRDVWRADEPRAGLTQAAALANAPETQDGCYAVPKTVGGEG